MNDRLEAALSVDWGPLSDYTKSGISHLRAGAQTDHKWAMPEVEGPYHHVWFAKLEPGGFAVPHIDAGKPFYERWHIPIVSAGFFWEDGSYFEAPSEPFRVRYWLPHAVWNPTDTTRIHLMVDRKVVPEEAPESSELILTDMIPEIQELIDMVAT